METFPEAALYHIILLLIGSYPELKADRESVGMVLLQTTRWNTDDRRFHLFSLSALKFLGLCFIDFIHVKKFISTITHSRFKPLSPFLYTFVRDLVLLVCVLCETEGDFLPCPIYYPLFADRSVVSKQRHSVKYAWYPRVASLSKEAVVPVLKPQLGILLSQTWFEGLSDEHRG